jgi:hypothetical protein
MRNFSGRKSGGLALFLVAGVSAAALYAKPRLSSADAQQMQQGSLPALDVVQRNAQSQLTQQSRVFSPATPLIEATEIQANSAVRLAQAQARPSDAQARPNGFVAPLSSEGSRRLASSKPGDDDARRELTRDLQKELKRVGCFDGEINGTWSPASKKAMSSFMDRVNATLPVEEPDYILLTLVQGHSAQACGKACPSGQGLSNDGRCQPRAILAQSARKSDDRKLVDRVDKAKAVEPKVAEVKSADAIQTGSLAKPTAPAASSWATSTVAPPVAQVPPPATAQLPGRMAMGAPIPTPEDGAKLDDIEARKRRAQAALADEQKAQAKVQADAERLKAERQAAEDAQRREQKIKGQALAEAERLKAERQKADLLSADADKRERQVAAADARRTAQRQAEALEADAGSAPTASMNETAKPDTTKAEAAKVAALAAAAVATREANERRIVARRARETREREEQRAADRERDRRIASAPAQSVTRRVEPRYIPTVAAARVAPSPTPRPSAEQRWTRTIFSDITRSR